MIISIIQKTSEKLEMIWLKDISMKTSELVKNVGKFGLKISKEKLLDQIKKSPTKEFSISAIEAKMVVVTIPLS